MSGMRAGLFALPISLWSALALGQAPARPAQVARPAPVAPAAPAAPAAAKAPPAAKAATVGLPQTGLTLELPKGWTSEATQGGTEAFVLLSPDQVTTLMLFGVPAAEMEAAMGDLEKTLRGVVTDAKLDEPAEGLVGGMPAIMADGKAKMDGNEVELGLLVVLNEARQRVLFIVGFSLPGKGEAYASDVAAILHSVRKVD